MFIQPQTCHFWQYAVMCRFSSQIKNQMKIYTIEHEKFAYDSYMGHVVVANSEDEVRQLAKNTSADEGKDVWDDAKVEECGEYTCHRTEPFILMSDFRAG